MGRSVETIGENVLYFDASDEYYQENFAWNDLRCNLQESLNAVFPSLYNVDKWASYPYQENRSFLENDFVTIYLSEYCGCGAISIVVSEDTYLELADYWLGQVWKRLTKIVGGQVDLLIRTGTFSNGCSVFKKVNTEVRSD